MKILLIDIETRPSLAYVWGLWDQNISLDKLVATTEIISWAAKWYDEDYVYFDSTNKRSSKKMLKGIHKLLDEADVVVHYNGARFDIPHLNREFIEHGYAPPSPYKQLDLLNTAKRVFKFTSNKLEFVAKALGVGSKLKHQGFDLWKGCMAGDQDCWKTMEDYNIHDVVLLQEVYDKFKPWVKNHPNHSIYSDGTRPVCPKCGSEHVQKRGIQPAYSSTYQRYQCSPKKGCGTWFRDSKVLNRKQFKTSEVPL